MNKGIFKDVSSKKPTLKNLLAMKRLSFSSGDKKAQIVEERIHQQDLAFVLDNEMLERFGVSTPKDFVEKINELIKINNEEYNKYSYHDRPAGLYHIYQKFEPEVIPIKKLTQAFNSSFEFKSDKTITKKEKCVLNVLNEISDSVARLVEHHMKKKDTESKKVTPRSISIGVSEVAKAWTDGMSYIAFSDKHVMNPNVTELVHLMIHEYCHNEATNETHSHGIEFYEMFHDILIHQVYQVENIIKRFNVLLLGQFTKAGIRAAGIDDTVTKAEKISELA